jgi:hypothetical protein
VNRRQLDVIAYLREENRVLKEHLGEQRLHFTSLASHNIGEAHPSIASNRGNSQVRLNIGGPSRVDRSESAPRGSFQMPRPPPLFGAVPVAILAFETCTLRS